MLNEATEISMDVCSTVQLIFFFSILNVHLKPPLFLSLLPSLARPYLLLNSVMFRIYVFLVLAHISNPFVWLFDVTHYLCVLETAMGVPLLMSYG